MFACATISNDNLQDLKTGQLVGASPWRQQVALIVGVGAGAAVIPPVLNLLAHAYGFAGAANVASVAQQPLPAPQATLISALAQGVIGGNLDWKMIGIGVARRRRGHRSSTRRWACLKRLRLPPLAVGIGIYLPMSATFAVVVGAVVGHWYNERAKRSAVPDRAERLGVLVASGMIVGETLFGVLNAGLIVAFSSEAPMALVAGGFRRGQSHRRRVVCGAGRVALRLDAQTRAAGEGRWRSEGTGLACASKTRPRATRHAPSGLRFADLSELKTETVAVQPAGRRLVVRVAAQRS